MNLVTFWHFFHDLSKAQSPKTGASLGLGRILGTRSSFEGFEKTYVKAHSYGSSLKFAEVEYGLLSRKGVERERS